MKRSMIFATLALMLCLTGCGEASYADGTYTGRSADYVNEEDPEAGNGYGVVTLTISGGQITACDYKTYELNGSLKDEEYGKENGEIKNRDFYNKAQKARAACDNYAQQLVAKQKVKDVDAVSGATVNYNEFKEAVAEALKQAQQ
ncbi:MAG: FMN-binding protein [Oscillospiraceae bacterium]|nr:FMN-binding protein [Oscillospiraceae bacterium]